MRNEKLDILTDEEHRHAMFMLRALQTPEQRHRADRISQETKGLPMKTRVLLAKEFLLPPISRLAMPDWDRMLDERLEREAVGF